MIKKEFIGATFYFPKQDKRTPVVLSEMLDVETAKRLKELIPQAFEQEQEQEQKPVEEKPKQRRKRK